MGGRDRQGPSCGCSRARLLGWTPPHPSSRTSTAAAALVEHAANASAVASYERVDSGGMRAYCPQPSRPRAAAPTVHWSY